MNATKDKALVLTDLNNKIVVQTESTTLTFPQGNDQAIKQALYLMEAGADACTPNYTCTVYSNASGIQAR